MRNKILIGGLAAILLIVAGGTLWARSVLAGDGVRIAIAEKISEAIGQPVTIGTIGATVFPRVTVNLGEVTIGQPVKVRVGTLHVGTDFKALLSRRIEHARLRLTGARVELPLPAFKMAPSEPAAEPAASPVELVSIDEVVLSGVEIVSGGRTLRGDIEVVPEQGGTALQIRKIALTADDATLTATGQITDISGPKGEMSLKSTLLDFDRLMAFANDFQGGAGVATSATPAATSAPRSASPSGLDITVSLDADRATMGALTLDKLSGKAHITADNVRLDPARFGVFGGRYEGTLTLTPQGDTVDVQATSTLTNVDVAAATAFAGSPNTVTGRLSGTLDIAARGADSTALTNSARGKLRVDIVDGVVKNLGLVNAVVVATSMRSGSMNHVTSGSKDEPFSKLGATLAIGNGAMTTNDLRFEAKDLSLTAQGAVQLVASTIDLKGRVQLSDELSKQAGSDLTKYTQDQGRVTLPATVSGPAAAPSVKIDVGDMAKRAVTNAATSEVQKRVPGLSGLPGFGKR